MEHLPSSKLVRRGEDIDEEDGIRQRAAARTPVYPLRRHVISQAGIFCLGFHQGLFFPTIAYTITTDLGFGARIVGVAFFIFMATAIACLSLLPRLLRILTPRSVFLWTCWIRVVSAGFYIAVPSAYAMFGSTPALWILMVGRFLHGTSPVVQVCNLSVLGVRVSSEERPKWVVATTLSLSIGMLLGPQIGTFIATYAATNFAASATSGWLMLWMSLLLGLGFVVYYDDYEMLTAEEPPAVTDPEIRKLILLYALMACFAFAGVLAMESILGLIAFDLFDQGPAEAWLVWAQLSVSIFLGSMAYNVFRKLLGSVGPCVLLLYVLSTAGGALLINWANLSVGVSYGVFLVSLTMMMTGTLGCVIAYMATIVDKLPDSLITTGTSSIAVGQVIGRAIGPIITTWVYQQVKVSAPAESMLADNVALLVQYGYVLISIAIGVCNYSFVFVKEFRKNGGHATALV